MATAVVLTAIFACQEGLSQETPRTAKAYKDLVVTESFRRTNGWTAGDGAFSVPLSDGRVLWLFGDSHADDYDAPSGTIPCLFQARNAGLVGKSADAREARTLLGSGPGFKSWFEDPEDKEVWFWPQNGFQQGNIVYVYLSAIRKTGSGGMWGFESAGRDWLAKIQFPELETVSYAKLPDFAGISFGCGFEKEDGFVYAFGSKRKGLDSDVFVARFSQQNPENRWSFWNGHGWNADVTRAAAMGRGTSSSVHVCRVKDLYVLTTSAFSVACDQGRDIFMSTSARPEGPFSAPKKVYTVDERYQGHYPFFYLPVAHPEFINEKDELLVTYCINGYEPCVSSCVQGRSVPDHYRPKAIRVPLSEIEPR